MGADKVFDLERNPDLLNTIRTDVIMIGLNFSRELASTKAFANFHDLSPYANDFKIRYAFEGTSFWGAYMTDALKNLIIPDAHGVRKYMKEHPEVVAQNIQKLEHELNDIGASRPQLISFGRDTYGILKKHLNKDTYSEIIQVPHYSHQIKKEEYRTEVLKKLSSAAASL